MMLGNLYFVQEGLDGPIKIGFTRQTVEQRLRSFETGNSSPLRILGWIVAPALAERRWHKEFSACRKHGEWFYPTAALLKAVQAALESSLDVLSTPQWEPVENPRQKVREWMLANSVSFDLLADRTRYSVARLKTILCSDYPITMKLARAIEQGCEGVVTASDLLVDNSRIGCSGMPAEKFNERERATSAA